jgi:hypothetical protein
MNKAVDDDRAANDVLGHKGAHAAALCQRATAANSNGRVFMVGAYAVINIIAMTRSLSEKRRVLQGEGVTSERYYP